MALNPILTPLTYPEGQEFPGTPQGLLDLQAEFYEITGLENFNGINYGSATPDSADRDKPWFRLNNGGIVLGWYAWDGSDWVLLPVRCTIGDTSDRDATISPQDGQQFFVTGSSGGLYVYANGEWNTATPVASVNPGDKHYFYTSYQLLASATNEVTSWTTLDLSSYMTAAGLTEDNTLKAAIIKVEISQGVTGFVTATYDATIRVGSDDTASTSVTDTLNARAFIAADDSKAAGAANSLGFVPAKVGTSNIFYNVTKASAALSNLVAKVWLTGFVYT